MRYRTILADPPWKQKMTGKWKREPNRRKALPYSTMTVLGTLKEITVRPKEVDLTIRTKRIPDWRLLRKLIGVQTEIQFGDALLALLTED